MPPLKVAYFTAGTLGAGHLVRGLAIGRGLARNGARCSYRIFAPPGPFDARLRGWLDAPGLGAPSDAPRIQGQLDASCIYPRRNASLQLDASCIQVQIAQGELRDAARASQSQLAQALRSFAPDLLLVDCYWAPLRHILPLADCEAWLLGRWLPSLWFGGPPGARWEPRQYARIVAIEPFALRGQTDEVPPIVICNPEEAKPRGSLRSLLKAAGPLRVSMHAGVAGEAATLLRAAAGGAQAHENPAGTRVFDLHAQDALFPLAEWLGDADFIESAAGYNSYWEARWMGTFARTRWIAIDRQRPEQEWRLAHCGQTKMRANGADVLAEMIA